MGPSRPSTARRFAWGAAITSCALLGGCFHDFNAFDPVAGSDSDGGTEGPSNDAAGPPTYDAPGESHDAHVPTADSSSSNGSDASKCGADCRIEATSCAGVCAEVEQSCAAACDGGGCTNDCIDKESTCTANCVTSCETCTSGEGCVDQAGCTAAAP